MKNIFFFVLGILFMGTLSVYPTTKEKFCKGFIQAKIYHKKKLVLTSNLSDRIYSIPPPGSTSSIGNSKNYAGDSVTYEVKYK